MKAKVYVTLKPSVLDPQGKAIHHSVELMGFEKIDDIRQGKYFEIALDDSASESEAKEAAEKIAKDVLAIIISDDKTGLPREIVEKRGLKQVTDLGAIEKIVDDIIAGNPDKVEQAKTNDKLVGWFVGQAMKSSGGKANPQAVNDLLKKKLGV